MATVTNDVLYSTTLTSSTPSVVLTIPTGYTHVRINASLKADSLVNTYLRLNGVTANDYSWTRMYGTGSLKSSQQAQNQNAIFLGDVGTSDFTSDEIWINNYRNTNFSKNVLTRSSATSAVQESTGTWRSTSAVTSVTIFTSSGNFIAGSTFKIYGLLAADVSPKATGGTIYSDDTHFYHVFGASGTFTPTQSITADALIVGGGGGGGQNFGGGGGGGKVTTLTNQSLTATGYTVTIGGGGAGGNGGNGSSGGSSSFNGTTATGGGGGGQGSGSGGTSGNGYAGGTGYYPGPPDVAGGGGGGASQAGYNSTSTSGNRGGDGLPYTYPHGEIKYFGGGGNGGSSTYSANGGWGWYPRLYPFVTPLGGGALGGGGYGGYAGLYRGNGDSGVANTGGGGGGGAWDNSTYGYFGGNGGSGIVVIKYLKA